MASVDFRHEPSPPPPVSTEREQTLSPRRYLLALAATATLTLAAFWLYVLAAPLAFLDPEYPYWVAKQELLRNCDLGTVLIVGDSRAGVGIIPARLGVTATNLAVGGGESIEAYAVLRRALACPDLPRRVVISFGTAHFVQPDLFWDRSVRFGALDLADLRELGTVSERLDDVSVLDQKRADGLPRGIRALLYATKFPGLYYASLLKGGVLLRWADNRARLRASLASRGQFFFGTAAGSSAVAIEGHLDSFRPLPVLDAYFDHMLALLAARHIPTDFLSMPLNATTGRAVPLALRDGLATYLAGYAARYPNFHVVGPLMPDWNDGWFGDEFAHLNPAGAALFSARFGVCLRALIGDAPGAAERTAPGGAPGEALRDAPQATATKTSDRACVAFDQPRLHDAPPSTQNAAQWGWFNATAPDASASVPPISKRGS